MMGNNNSILILGGLGAIGMLFISWKRKQELTDEDTIGNVLQWTGIVKRHAEAEGVPFVTVLALLWSESSGEIAPSHSSGELGLMGLKPIAFREVGIEPTVQPDQNIEAGTKFYAKILGLTGSEYDALRAYKKVGTNVNGLSSGLGSVEANLVLERKKVLLKKFSELTFSQELGISSTGGIGAIAVTVGNKIKDVFNGFFD